MKSKYKYYVLMWKKIGIVSSANDLSALPLLFFFFFLSDVIFLNERAIVQAMNQNFKANLE